MQGERKHRPYLKRTRAQPRRQWQKEKRQPHNKWFAIHFLLVLFSFLNKIGQDKWVKPARERARGLLSGAAAASAAGALLAELGWPLQTFHYFQTGVCGANWTSGCSLGALASSKRRLTGRLRVGAGEGKTGREARESLEFIARPSRANFCRQARRLNSRVSPWNWRRLCWRAVCRLPVGRG